MKLLTEPANYLEAILDCHTQGAVLVTVHSQEEQDTIHGLTGSKGAWIGLTDFLDEGTFSWVDQETKAIYRNWKDGAPEDKNSNQHCTWIMSDGKWNSQPCKEEKQYVCQKPLVKVIVGE